MNYIITTNQFGWEIKNQDNNYLTYIEHWGVAETSYGVIDSKEFSQGSFKKHWKKCGKGGKISENTWNKLLLMDEYFYQNYFKQNN